VLLKKSGIGCCSMVDFSLFSGCLMCSPKKTITANTKNALVSTLYCIRTYVFVSFIFFLTPVIICSAEEKPQLLLDFPLIDYPFNWTNGYTFPSMGQSLNLSKNFYQYTHNRISNSFVDKPEWGFISILGFDVLATWVPFGNAWLHEEWHRAVLSHRKINSHNDIYDFDLFSETIAVSEVTDEDLIRLKADHPADMVRMHAAGFEAQYELNFALEKDSFYFDTQSWNNILLWLNSLNSIAYLNICASKEADKITEELNEQSGTNISKRDFTGLDCTAWVYDLFRPDEPYEERGVHPSGVGIDRYIQYSDLTDKEKQYLKLQRNLSLINLLDPFLFNRPMFSAINPVNNKVIRWNINARHLLTPFGYSIDANLFLKQGPFNLMIILHSYSTDQHKYPGFELQMLRLPLVWQNQKLFFSTKMALWVQPKGQKFRTQESQPGGLLSVKINYPVSKTFETYIGVEQKTDGWVAGNVYLEDVFSLQLGLIYLLY
jgi:hypothetical protein